ncbi:DUF1963 domain-containing protein [Lentzea cavernae]|uniref:DUF1963 domain-containing protein n=1 Tax=Lentzea cavernae TaxID=2020703 RepID=A0ABQ3LWN9_9PSEU|nr:DUF1963 domain-containing protein [Lentzea cavernae]GHH28192.1 hypothetical protein GCM10017774_01970 [Lentzea cavernae]
MNRYEQFRRAAVDRGLPEDEVDKFADQLRFAVWLGTGSPDDEVVGQSGGLPRLPVGTEWPGTGNGSPLPFVASVDCALLPRAEGLPLPEDGSLLFFLNHDDDMEAEAPLEEPDHARVVHVPAGTETEEASPPEGHATRTFFHENIPFLIPEHRLSAWVRPVLPDWLEEQDAEFASDAVKQLLDDLKHVEELLNLVDELWPDPNRGAALRLGGYCREIGGQDPPYTQMASAALSATVDPDLPRAERTRLRREEEHRLNTEWLPLAQFHTTSEFYYGCFLISTDDLAARRFDQMRSFTMFTE